MTMVDVVQESPPRWSRRRRIITAIVAIDVFIVLFAAVAAVQFYASVPEPGELRPQHAVVDLREVPMPVLNTFVAAVDPDFYEDPFRPWSGSLITRRYAAAAVAGDDVSSWRVGIMASKLEDRYTRTELLGFYLNNADFGRGTAGLATAAQTRFGKPVAQLSVAEAAVLAVPLAPEADADPRRAWESVLDTMVERGWLSQAERAAQTYPA
ncbi:transglycosylase domain-containing protein [Catellatospora bangladeshensis]|uniref:Glycosyl transferase family 51 domain-containing protein n=1 Tax=Catellatospora bangladeshensis TaxID=310355 RepID=A0A8J3JMZ3_9ACTN|nr:transglycosylase domain-containing protein [Catellatospora bangladeshensis]GIF83617.1 hypothetical protein Cba03nite_49660 [Catellatospora bangladeshensis]